MPVCVILGAGPGLGTSCAARFAQGGYTIVLMCRSEESCEGAKKACAEAGVTHGWVKCDVIDPASVKEAFATSKSTYGVCDVLIYNPGLKSPKVLNTDVMDVDLETFNATHALFCTGALLCVQAVLPDMLAKEGVGEGPNVKKGTILFTGATGAFRGGAKSLMYSQAEMGMRAVSQSVARGYAAKGIHTCFFRLDCVIDTPWVVKMMNDYFKAGKMASCKDIADTYYWVHTQPALGWTNELDIRPCQENWSF